tara:strand:- start:3434 stop:4339 length:906 start_codon:yes stop_codon:yes gene_type:complete
LKNHYKILASLLICLFTSQFTLAQELNCTVSVRADKISATNKRIFETLETAMSEFLNNTKWTDVEFAPEEKIKCSFLVQIDEFALPGRMSATLQITASRPIYNSSISSTIFNHQDRKFSFSYLENSPIFFTPNQYQNNLSSVLAFYAYMILGYDADSFQQNGGTEFFSQAQRVVNNAQNSSEPGWKSFDDQRNRFWMVDNALQKLFQPLRDAYYQYHRKGMDTMYDNPVAGRAQVLLALQALDKVHKAKPLSFNMQMFFNTKQMELISIFKEAPDAEKDQFISIASTLDPTRGSNYAEIKK